METYRKYIAIRSLGTLMENEQCPRRSLDFDNEALNSLLEEIYRRKNSRQLAMVLNI